jgi:hypothetical protein
MGLLELPHLCTRGVQFPIAKSLPGDKWYCVKAGVAQETQTNTLYMKYIQTDQYGRCQYVSSKRPNSSGGPCKYPHRSHVIVRHITWVIGIITFLSRTALPARAS